MNADPRQTRPRVKELVTPEGVALELRIPDPGERLGAFTIDFAFVVLALAALQLAVLLVGLTGLPIREWSGVVAIIGGFLIWNGYYIWFESQPRGATPGKRRVGLRVIDRRGGPLRPGAIVARNIVRNFEFLVPLLAMTQFGIEGLDENFGKFLLALSFVVVCGVSPIFHPDRLRPGEWIAGTLVIANPIAELKQDLARTRLANATHAFTREELSIYGVYELQVLEDLLRAGSGLDLEKAGTVANAIRRKIGFRREVGNPKVFLREFYAAQRAHLERDLALGKRKDSKDDAPKRK